MPTTPADRYRRWFDYERDATAKALASLDTVPADRRDSAEYRKAVSVLGHVVAARRAWLFRLGVALAPAGPMFPDDADVGRVAADWNAVAGQWADYFARLDDAELARVCEYQSLDAGRFRNRVEDILTQLYGHSLYHRGQVATLVKMAGGQPAATDFIYWCREPAGGAS
jgi:uncharacterized damage-inducible protein DinB